MAKQNDKTIEIKCETKDRLNIAEMTELQGALKARTDIDYDKIKLSIIKYGFSFPFFVWNDGKKNYILDGHGRFATLCKMQKDGYSVPDLPVVYVACKDKNEAKQKLLRLNSQYGKMTRESVLEFSSGLDLNFEELALPDTTLDFSNVSEEAAAETEGDDDTPEVDEKGEPVSKRGEMYELGNSILMCGSCFELCWSKNKHKRDIARVKWVGVFGTEQEFDHKRYHPTQKPIKLIEWFLTRYARGGQLVVDLFGGSGSTLIGCEKNGLRCRTMELDPHYCDVIRKRYTLYAKQNGLKITSGCLE